MHNKFVIFGIVSFFLIAVIWAVIESGLGKTQFLLDGKVVSHPNSLAYILVLSAVCLFAGGLFSLFCGIILGIVRKDDGGDGGFGKRAHYVLAIVVVISELVAVESITWLIFLNDKRKVYEMQFDGITPPSFLRCVITLSLSIVVFVFCIFSFVMSGKKKRLKLLEQDAGFQNTDDARFP